MMPIIDQVIPIIVFGVFGFALSLYIYLNSIKNLRRDVLLDEIIWSCDRT